MAAKDKDAANFPSRLVISSLVTRDSTKCPNDFEAGPGGDQPFVELAGNLNGGQLASRPAEYCW